MARKAVTLDIVLDLARQLSSSDQQRLVSRLTEALADPEVVSPAPEVGNRQEKPKFTTHGLLAHLGPAPSAEEIDEVRREMWANFPRDDIA